MNAYKPSFPDDTCQNESAFGFERSEDSPGFLLWQTTITWQRLIKKELDIYDISHAQFVIMAILLWFQEHHVNPTQVLIAQQTKLDKMTVSKSLKKLVSLGFVDRTEHETDTRAKSVMLTNKGKNMAQKLVPIVEQIDVKFFGAVSQGAQQALLTTLNELVLFNE